MNRSQEETQMMQSGVLAVVRILAEHMATAVAVAGPPSGRTCAPRALVCSLLLVLACSCTLRAQSPELAVIPLGDPSAWRGMAAENVTVDLSAVPGRETDCLAMHFDFTRNKAYVIAAREVDLVLPENYRFAFWLRGAAPNNTLEFKLVDEHGNTFWRVFRDLVFPGDWKRMTLRKDDIVFAWGTNPGKPLGRIRSIEIAVSCGQGGQGDVFFEGLVLEEIPVSAVELFRRAHSIEASASASCGDGFPPTHAADNDIATQWKTPSPHPHWLQLDLGAEESIAGVEILWRDWASEYDIRLSGDGREWRTVASEREGDGGSDLVYFAPQAARYVRLDCRRSGPSSPFSVSELRVIPGDLAPSVTAPWRSSGAGNIVDGSLETAWQGGPGENQSVTIDFQELRLFGGFVIRWRDCLVGERRIETSDDGENWVPVHKSARPMHGDEYVFLDDASGRYVRLSATPLEGSLAISELNVRGPDESLTAQRAFLAASRHAPAGCYPPWVGGEQEFWTVLGVVDDDVESLLSENGTLEPWHYAWSLAPFLRKDGRLVTRADGEVIQGLADSHLPLPTVTWKGSDYLLEVEACAADPGMQSSTYLRYTVVNRGAAPMNGDFLLALRPFQVNPPWMAGGLASVNRVEYDSQVPGLMKVNGVQALYVPEPPSSYGAARYARAGGEGDIVTDLSDGLLTPAPKVFIDPEGLGSVALSYPIDLAPGESRAFCFAVPLHDTENRIPAEWGAANAEQIFLRKREAAETFWRGMLERVRISLPDREIVETFKSSLAYILINDDNFRLEPGARNYEKSWTRDGALMARALLVGGFNAEVRRYLDWLTGLVREDGWVPFIIDNHDQPVTFGWKEFDSQGEFLYALSQYYNFTRDRSFLAPKKDQILAAVEFAHNLREERKTEEYEQPDRIEFYGLLPESASHEGYADHPMHSYWDDLWVIAGLKGAAAMLETLGDPVAAARVKEEERDLAECLHRSMSRVCRKYNLDHFTGCADRPWPDPTATAIAAWPCGELGRMPRDTMLATLDFYWSVNMEPRLAGTWEGDFTPYELRLINAFTLTDQRERLGILFEKFMEWKRPRAWNHWAEVVTSGYRAPHYLGDMPHTWIAGEYVNAVRNLLVVEDEGRLELGRGLLPAWFATGGECAAFDLPTEFGPLEGRWTREGDVIRVDLEGRIRGAEMRLAPPPVAGPVARVTLDGRRITPAADGSVTITRLPARVEFVYAEEERS